MIKKNCKSFSVDCDLINTSDILDIHECLIKETYYKTMFGVIKKNVY